MFSKVSLQMCATVKGRVDMEHLAACDLVQQVFKHKITYGGAGSCTDFEGNCVPGVFCGLNKGSLISCAAGCAQIQVLSES